MKAFVYRHKRVCKGRTIIGRMYRGRYRLDGMAAPVDVALHTPDKQVAVARLKKLVQEVQMEGEGLIPQKSLRLAGQRILLHHVQDFVTDLTVSGRDDEYVDHVDYRLGILFRDLKWTGLRDLSADGFQQWRAQNATRLAAKTVNEYLNSLNVFCNWLVRNGRLAESPFKLVSRLQTAGKERYVRRALSLAESSRLLAVSDDRRLSYLLALRTGLRRTELASLQWGDVDLDAASPALTVRAETAKNRKRVTMALHTEVAAALRAAKPASVRANDPILSTGVPDMETFKGDLKRAGIPYKDDQGRVVDFHALRKTLCTDLGRAGVNPWQAMRIMRHSDIQLTVRTYTDASQLPLQDALAKLASLTPDRSKTAPTAPSHDTPLDTPAIVPEGHLQSQAVTENRGTQRAGKARKQGSESRSDTPSHGGSPKVDLVLGGGLEPPRLSAYAPQTYVSAIPPPEQKTEDSPKR